MSQTPSIGRIVHYQSYGTPGGEFVPEPRAAIVTEVAGHVPSDRWRTAEGDTDHDAIAEITRRRWSSGCVC